MRRLSPFLRPAHYVGAFAVLLLLLLVYLTALQGVFFMDNPANWGQWWDSYLLHILRFSFKQAFLSALLSVCLGLVVARSLFYQGFVGKKWLLRLFALTFVLPALVAIFGILGVYGLNGWLANLLQALDLPFAFNIYGLNGILLTHLFFNIPFAARLFLQALQAIPSQQRQLSAQLNLRGWQFIRLVEWAYLRQQLLPSFILIFMLCFTSFTIVLTLGGGPQYTSLDVAIYQAIIFDFDLARAAFYACLQFGFCFLLFVLTSLWAKTNITESHTSPWLAPQSRAVKIWQIFVIILSSAFILLPLLSLVINALSSQALSYFWQNRQLWRALGYSAAMSLSSATLALALACLLLLFSRRLVWLGWQKVANLLMNMGMLILSIPTLLLAIGLFIWLQGVGFSSLSLFFIVVLCNALAALPFVLRILTVPLNYNMYYYEKLCQSLGIRGLQRLRLIEWHNLAQPFKYAFALAATLSLGDFTAIALFGNQDFISLPYLLYQQLGSYRSDEAAITALILLLFCLGYFMWAERHKPQSKPIQGI